MSLDTKLLHRPGNRFSEYSRYWLQAAECIVADKKEKAVLCKQAAETMDKFLTLKKEAAELVQKEKKNQDGQNGYDVSYAADPLLQSVVNSIQNIKKN